MPEVVALGIDFGLVATHSFSPWDYHAEFLAKVVASRLAVALECKPLQR